MILKRALKTLTVSRQTNAKLVLGLKASTDLKNIKGHHLDKGRGCIGMGMGNY